MATARPFDPDLIAVRQRFLRTALAVLLGLTVSITLAPLAWPSGPWTWGGGVMAVTAVSAAVYLFAMWRNSSGHIEEATKWMALGITIGVLGPVFVFSGQEVARSYSFVTISILIVAFTWSWRAGAGVGIVNGTALVVVALTRPGYAADAFFEDIVILATFSGLILTFAAYNEANQRSAIANGDELRHTVSDLRALLDNSPDAMLTVRSDGEILRLNGVAQSWARELSVAHLAAGDNLRALIGDNLWAQVDGLMEEAATDESASAEFEYPGPEGALWFKIHFRRIEASADTYAVQLRDTTDSRKAAEQELEGYRNRLELDKLRELDSFRTRLLNIASHEMRTPMTPLRLQLGILERRLGADMDERTKHSFSTIKRNVVRLTMLLDDLLDVAKLESDELQLKLESTSVDRLVGGEAEVYRAMAESQGLRLLIDSHVAAEVDADPQRLAQVFSNLLSNAIKYARSEIRVTARRQGEEAIVEVTDDGAGFPPGVEKGLWEPFIQVQPGDQQQDGTGLGLYICRGIIERHGGRIWAESAGPGHGACFAFSLPLRASLKYEGEPIVVHE